MVLLGAMQTRRKFLRDVGVGLTWSASSIAMAHPLLRRASGLLTAGSAAGQNPLDVLATGSPFASRDFNGDEIDRPHDLLWNKAEVLAKRGGLPPIEESHPVIVIGGGIAGLTAAYRLRDQGPLVLESASRFGGNAKAERFKGTEMALGAAYVSAPEPGATPEGALALIDELGLLSEFKREDGMDATACRDGRIFSRFWDEPSHVKIFEELLEVGERGFPDIPLNEESKLSRAELDALDRLTFSQWLAGTGWKIPVPVRELLELYLWSSFATESDQVSAAQALNFLCSDLRGTLAAPGGNARVASALFERLQATLGPDRLRTGTFVVDVRQEESGVRVSWVDLQGRWHSARASRVVMATPKVVARFVVEGLPKPQLDAMTAIKSRAYLVANLLLKNKRPSPGYELYRLGTRENDGVFGSPLKEMQERPCTDLTFANWASGDAGQASVLTLYRALPYEGARQLLFSPFAHDRHRDQIEKQLPSLLQAMGLSPDDVAGMRLTRWGHAIPVAQAGHLANGVLERAHSPAFDGRLWFCGQDNWANPCLETSVATAEEAVRAVRV